MERERVHRRVARFLIPIASPEGVVAGVNAVSRGFASRSVSMCPAKVVAHPDSESLCNLAGLLGADRTAVEQLEPAMVPISSTIP